MSKNPIDLIDAKLLKLAAPETKEAELAEWVQPIKDACIRFNIDTVREVACFLAQSGHESGGFRRLTENLNYRADRLRAVWPKRFPSSAIASRYEGNPEKLANYVYASRMGNGSEQSGDGWRFRGRGLFQLTGRDNYTAFGKSLGIRAESAAQYIESGKEGAAMSAAWFFDYNNIDALAETAGVEDETRRINGGTLGLPERRSHFDSIVKELLKRGA
jgi:putative chitinase